MASSSCRLWRTHTTSTTSARQSTSTTKHSLHTASTSSTSPNPSTYITCRKQPCFAATCNTQYSLGPTALTSDYRYPGPTLKALELLQQEQFRKDILRPDVVERLATEWMSAANGRKETEVKAE